MVKFVKLLFLILISLLFLQNLTFGQDGVHEHDGFFLRLQAGGGSGSMIMSMEGISNEIEFSGFAGAGALQIGGTIGTNLIVFCEFSGMTISDPTIKVGEEEGEVENVKANFSGFGAGLTYYFMPSNFYVSGALLATQANLKFEDDKGETDFGFGFRISAGMEWWVGDDWGIGLYAFGAYGSAPDKDNSDLTISSTSFGGGVSITFN